MDKLIHRIADRKSYAVMLLLGLSSFFYIGLGYVNLFDWDEINFAESAREMIVSGDYWRVQIDYLPFWEKPPFFFWLQSASMHVFGINEFAARFPNALFGSIYLLTFYFIGRKHFTPIFGLIWSLLYFGSLLPHIYFKSGIIDPVFNYFIFLSVYFFMLAVEGEEKNLRNFFLAGLLSGLSVFTKGPVGFLLLGLTVFFYFISTRFRGFPGVKKVLIFSLGLFAIVGLWLGIELYQNGWAMLLKFISYQVELFTSPVAGHKQPFYYHFLVLFLGCFPISIFGLSNLVRLKMETVLNFHRWMRVLFWVVLILFSITTTKIIHYSSMCYIPLSFLAAYYIYEHYGENRQLKKVVINSALFLGSIWSILLILFPIIMKNKQILYNLINDEVALQSIRDNAHFNGWEAIGGLIFLSALVFGYIQERNKKLLKGLLFICLAAPLALMIINFTVLPKVERISQGSAIDMYKSLSKEDAYIESYGHKSYAKYFYSEVKPTKNERRRDIHWLMEGDIDKPVFLISKINNKDLSQKEEFTLLKEEGGFRLYRRMPKKKE